MNPTPKIVVTGFEPFAHGSENPTLEVLGQLRRSNDIEGELTTVQMPVDSRKLAELTSAKLDELQPDVWISLGVAARTCRRRGGTDRCKRDGLSYPRQCRRPARRGIRIRRSACGPVRDAACEGDRVGASRSRHPREGLELAFDLPMQPDDVYGPASRRREEDGDPRRLHPRARASSFVAKQVYPLVEMPSMSVDLMTDAVKKAIRTAIAVEQDRLEPTFNY